MCRCDEADFDAKLKALFSAAKNERLTFTDSKCVFARSEIDLLGYRSLHSKIKPDPERHRPLLELRLPKTKSELERALELFSYCAKLGSDFSENVRPLV